MKNKLLKVILGISILSVMSCGEANSKIDRIPSKIKEIDLSKENKTNIVSNNYETYIGTYKINSKIKDNGGSLSLTQPASKTQLYSGYFTIDNDSDTNNFRMNYKFYYTLEGVRGAGKDVRSKDKHLEITIPKSSFTSNDANTLKIDNVKIPNNNNGIQYSIQMVKMFDRIGDINEREKIEIDKDTNSGLYPLIKNGPLCDVGCMDNTCEPNKDSAGRCSDIDAMFKFIGIYNVEEITSGCGDSPFVLTANDRGIVEATAVLLESGDVDLTIRMNIDLSKDSQSKCNALLNSSEHNKATIADKTHRFYYDQKYAIKLAEYDGLTAIFPAVGLESIKDNFYNVNFKTKSKDLKGDLQIDSKPFHLKLGIAENLSLNDQPSLRNENLITQNN